MLNNPPKKTHDRAFVVELDTAILHGITHSLEPLLALFSENGQKLDAWQYAQRVVGTAPERVPDLVFGPGAKPGMPEAIRSTIFSSLQKGVARLVPDVSLLVQEAEPKGVKVVLVSALSDTRLKELLGDALKDRVGVLQVTRSHCLVFKPEMWHAVCARAGLYERLCVAVAGSGISCRGALAAGLHCVVAHDPLMEGNDFGGADCVSARVDKKLIAEGLRRLRKS